MKKPVKVGAKVLGAMALPNFCPRCFWYRLHCGDGPFSVFPSIFNELDLCQKSLVHAHVDKHGRPPKWMGPGFSEAVGYLELGFMEWVDEKQSVLLKGSPDAVLYSKDQAKLFLGDYKTARYAAGKDHLLPQYRVQLLAYAFLLEKKGFKKPEKAALLYFGPPAEPTGKELLACSTENGFDLPFSVEVVDIELGDFNIIHKYIKRARDIYDYKTPPEGREGCRDCDRIDASSSRR
jgi:hypothetical protein